MTTSNNAVQKLRGALGLCKKAGALKAGFDAVCESVGKGEALLVLAASDASERTRRKLNEKCGSLCPVMDIPLSQQDIAVITHKKFGVLAVTDKGLSELCLRAVGNANDNAAGDTAREEELV